MWSEFSKVVNSRVVPPHGFWSFPLTTRNLATAISSSDHSCSIQLATSCSGTMTLSRRESNKSPVVKDSWEEVLLASQTLNLRKTFIGCLVHPFACRRDWTLTSLDR